MAIKFEKIQPGMRLAQIKTERAGNTTMRRIGVWYVQVKEVRTRKLESGRDWPEALVSWNGNKPEWWPASRLEKLYREDSPAVARAEEKSRNFMKGW